MPIGCVVGKWVGQVQFGLPLWSTYIRMDRCYCALPITSCEDMKTVGLYWSYGPIAPPFVYVCICMYWTPTLSSLCILTASAHGCGCSTTWKGLMHTVMCGKQSQLGQTSTQPSAQRWSWSTWHEHIGISTFTTIKTSWSWIRNHIHSSFTMNVMCTVYNIIYRQCTRAQDRINVQFISSSQCVPMYTSLLVLLHSFD